MHHNEIILVKLQYNNTPYTLTLIFTHIIIQYSIVIQPIVLVHIHLNHSPVYMHDTLTRTLHVAQSHSFYLEHLCTHLHTHMRVHNMYIHDRLTVIYNTFD